LIYYDLAPIALLAVSTLTAAFFAYIYAIKRQTYLAVWALGWSLLALHYVPAVLEPWLGASNWLSIASHFLMGTVGIAFFCSARLYANAKPLTRWAVLSAAIFAVWTVAAQFGKLPIRAGYGNALLLLAVAWVFWQESRRQETVIDKLLALVFFLWAPLILLVMHVKTGYATTLPNAAALGSAPQLLVAVLMVMAIHEEERRRVERNILALTNLNLSTSSFVGSEIKQTLSEALERVLSVARLPAGALFLQYGDANGPAASVSAGMDESFCQSADDNGLSTRLIGMIARQGGLKVFRDLDRDPQWSSDSQEEGFANFREAAVLHHLRTVVGISLQAKDEPFGVLLLATPENRQFTQAELRLLLALGHQIAMAVENSYLIQQSSRRSEELNILNEIGRTLSATLDPDTLFEKIYGALQSMFDVNNFVIALYDPARKQVRYELDIVDGIRLPKYNRPAGNGLTEYVLRTGQPLLFGRNLAAEAAELGIESTRKTGSLCCVPLMAYDRAIGAMKVYSHQEGAYKTGTPGHD
jgi:GAF domain-containing protein